MSVRHKQLLWLWGGLLAVLLSLLFLPLTAGERGLALLLVAVVTLAGVWLAQCKSRESLAEEACLHGLPDAPYRLPVVLVCGDANDWPGEGPVYRTAQGCWLQVPEASLQQTVRQLLGLRPELLPQLAVMACIAPQQHDDRDTLIGRLLTLRWQMVQIRRDTRRQVPLLLTSRIATHDTNSSIWQSAGVDHGIQVWQEGKVPVSASVWLSQEAAPARLYAQILFSAHTRFVSETVLPALIGDNPDMPAARPAVVLYHHVQGLRNQREHSLWQQFLVSHTTLKDVAGWTPGDDTGAGGLALPDFILPSLPQGAGITPRSRMLRRAFCLFTLAALTALCSSGWNNRQLLHRLSFDISQYQRTPVHDAISRTKAVTTLRADAAFLNGWWRNGEPLRYGLGFYRGEWLRLPVLAAIRSYVPPPPPPRVVKKVITGPQTVRLDSMSLFDSGKYQLKPGSTNVLVNALVDIKAKPGWLIVVSGHTDNTGDNPSNQVLSQKRAESVRDWMRDTGGVPESCFAVQGYGESRPIATNDTPEGRATNRRVEISLVPQANACRVPGTHGVSLTGDALKK
ncbi:OmpA family protein [Pseudescherichia sp.]|uniref:OmpA family protein n=1 Tax=Pseudescherichia sp. TaxID=2055881 RepID=UPI0028A168A1|nr:OmpA family protein [Pseudescherichia sp.]